jgi:signal transduction histidine kinase
LYLLIPPGAIPFALRGNSNARWEGGEELLIPLCSGGGATLGCVRLSSPRDPNAIDALQLSRIEMLAADLAVAVELKALHTQLGRSEKLAALGELLAGVAHEFNSPLTVIMGYANSWVTRSWRLRFAISSRSWLAKLVA